ncbi:helix-turn-helix domain-containing protein [Nonomuraea sp. C10]|uniref:helix-turn-helix domain-containing protein n=1 Tax=Nonomuraea sp. C10 TaxID=2600577 RepID=UPI0011CE7D1D|nr:cupin domain-containing protein [Nonomuraea sp. C10]TXK40088.1 cupin domain-containing protein [Nonomuraea sp. C10]
MLGGKAMKEEPGSLESIQIGSRLRSWRLASGLSLHKVADTSGLSPGYISQVERGLANPSLESLKRLADAVGMRIGDLFVDEGDGSPESSRFVVTKRGMRKQIRYPGSGILNELLTPDLQRQFEAIWVEAQPGATSGGHPHSHAGEECGVVIFGSMRFWVGNADLELAAGDSIYLDSTVPHRWVATGTEPLVAVWMITPPTF